jgi:hypothetical protein
VPGPQAIFPVASVSSLLACVLETSAMEVVMLCCQLNHSIFAVYSILQTFFSMAKYASCILRFQESGVREECQQAAECDFHFSR